jgi:ABC-2 type transport system permease protein
MHKIFVVVRREFVERVRSRWFIIGTVLGPLLMLGFLVLPILLSQHGGSRTIAVLDATTAGFGERVTSAINHAKAATAEDVVVAPARLDTAADSLATIVGTKAIDGFLILTDSVLADGKAEYRGTNVSSMSDMRTLENTLRSTVFAERLQQAGVNPSVVDQAQIPVDLKTSKIENGKVTGESGESAFILAYFSWLLLYIAILLYGIQVMGSVVEEKTSRVVEVLVSSLRPFELLSGKIIGVGAVGLFQLGIWLGFGKLALDKRAEIVGMISHEGGQAMAGFALPPVPIATIVVLLTYFVLGYFLYAAMFAAVASMASSEQDARQAQTPVTMLLVIPAMLVMGVINNPDGGLARAISLIPFSSPIAMPVRWVAAPIPLIELIESLAILVATVIAVMWLAGRIYRVGILMHGKRPKLKDVVQWIRA